MNKRKDMRKKTIFYYDKQTAENVMDYTKNSLQ